MNNQAKIIKAAYTPCLEKLWLFHKKFFAAGEEDKDRCDEDLDEGRDK